MQPTPSQTIGPFFHLCLAAYEIGGHLAGPAVQGERLTLIVHVLDGDGAPVDDAVIELWQADATFRGFGRLATDEQGACVFETVKPGRVTSSSGTPEAPHINVSVFARGLLKRAVTRIYFAGDPANEQDPVLALAPGERRNTLIARPDPDQPSAWKFDIHLCGEHETVFFEI
ncbi:MAG TPA: protocatechuate 3,4-dioxygenase subunit alpha [Bryobacteraceae bacterium]|nr:protocatechuate 3,4-dioxygenase subunit alpha [Bryobacteraceae bacterium]